MKLNIENVQRIASFSEADDPDALSEYCDTIGSPREVMQELCRLALSSLRAELGATDGPLTLDTDRQVFFYEQDHYYLSNFSAFKVEYDGVVYATSEHAYHCQRFSSMRDKIAVTHANSAHEAFRYAQDNKARQWPNWDSIKVDTMRAILRAKAKQHEYVRRKLLQTGDRELVENSWRDAYWGWGENRDGQNMLGKLWMQVRAELRHQPHSGEGKT